MAGSHSLVPRRLRFAECSARLARYPWRVTTPFRGCGERACIGAVPSSWPVSVANRIYGSGCGAHVTGELGWFGLQVGDLLIRGDGAEVEGGTIGSSELLIAFC